MIHLYEFLRAEPLPKEAAWVKDAICFTCDYKSTADAFSEDGALVLGTFPKLPFRQVWLEIEVTEEYLIAVALRDGGSVRGGYVFAKDSGAGWGSLSTVWVAPGDETVKMAFSAHHSQADKDAVGGFVSIAFSLFKALAEGAAEVTQHEVRTIKRGQLAKKGIPPLYTYHTLVLKPRVEPGPPLGGTHASPRAHLRRGHFRHYKSGKVVWVEAHAVGDKKLGLVHKDYDCTQLTTNLSTGIPSSLDDMRSTIV